MTPSRNRPAPTVRLNKFLANAGVAARRKCDTLIFDGKIRVNGSVVLEPGYQVHPEDDRVRMGRQEIRPQREIVVFMLHKPRGVVTTAADEHGRRQVTDLVPQDVRVYPVGRLDYQTTGLLLLTNDGELAYRLAHPRYEIDKVYVARLERPISDGDINRLCRGVSIKEKTRAAATVERVGAPADRRIRLTLHEGRNQQVRRMLEAIGHRVQDLDRTHYAGLRLGTLSRGTSRVLRKSEYNRLRKAVGLSPLS